MAADICAVCGKKVWLLTKKVMPDGAVVHIHSCEIDYVSALPKDTANSSTSPNGIEDTKPNDIEDTKHGTCEECGRPLELTKVWGREYCPACKKPFSQRLRNGVIYGGVVSLVCFVLVSFIYMYYEGTFLDYIAVAWPFLVGGWAACTVGYLLDISDGAYIDFGGD